MPPLLAQGICMTEFSSLTCAYPPAKQWQRIPWAALRLAEMSIAAIRSNCYDVILLQREMMSTFATLERWTGRPRVFDVDDAIHLYRGGAMARTLATHSDRVICGNFHLAEVYRQWNSDVVVLPTAVDTARYHPRASGSDSETIVLGWIGTSANLRYLQSVEPAINKVLKRYPSVMLHVVCDKPPQMHAVESARVLYTPWSVEIEVRAIQSFSIGLMPLEDSPWTRGKCSYKMLQYMSCGLPTVVSPVGMNADVLRLGEIGYGSKTNNEWQTALEHLIEDETARSRLGANGRQIVLREFSISSLAPRFACYLSSQGGTI